MIVVSVIVPIYNRSETLVYCLNSIKSLYFKDFEVILVDDGSTDTSSEICRDFCQQDCRFRYVYKDNGGVSSARNVGIDCSKGDWLAFVDSDDAVFPEHLDIIADGGSNFDWIVQTFSSLREIDVEKYAELRTYCSAQTITSNSPAEYYFTDYRKSGTPMFSVCGKFYRRDICNKYNIRFNEDLRWGEDQLFNLAYLRRINSIYHRPYNMTYIQMDRNIIGEGQRLSSKLLPLDDLYRVMTLNVEAFKEFDEDAKGENIPYYVNDLAYGMITFGLLAYTRKKNSKVLNKDELLHFTQEKLCPLFASVKNYSHFIQNGFNRFVFRLIVSGYCRQAINICQIYGYIRAIKSHFK